MKNVLGKFKWFIIAALVLIVAGMTLFGVLGFNNTVDYKDSYEVHVGIDQSVDAAKVILKDASENYFEEKDIKYSSCQVVDDGVKLIYKFKTDVTSDVSGLQTAIQTALDNDGSITDIDASAVEVYAVKGQGFESLQLGWVLLAFGISLVAIFLYAIFVEKVAGAVSIICSYLLSFLLFISIMAITRIPAVPYVEISAIVSAIVSAGLSIALSSRYREESKNTANAKLTVAQIAEKVAISEAKVFIWALVLALVVAIAIGAFAIIGIQYMLIIGAQLLLAVVVAVVTAYMLTPYVWTAIKNSKKRSKSLKKKDA